MASSIMESISAPLRRSDSLSPSDLDLGLGGAHHIADDDDVDDVDDDFREEFLCPFCADHYDVVALCCHIDDQHPLDANNGVCPVCAKKAGADLVGHITKEHGNFLKMQRIKRFRKGGSNSFKELLEGALQSLSGGTSCIASSSCEPDPLLSSFIFTPDVEADEPLSAQPCPFEAAQEEESSQAEFLERKPEQLQLLDKDQVENARRFEFVHGLLMSTVLDDNL